MVITPYFVFLHVPKTGGMWVRSVIPEEWSVARLSKHERRAAIPDEYAHLPVLAFVRNPWDWYVSHYMFHSRQEREERIEILFANGSSFDSFVRRAVYGKGMPVAEKHLEARGIDYYTLVFENLTGSGEGTWFGRFENLREDLLRFLEASDAPVTNELREKILKAPPENTSRHSSYREYYTDELRDLVGARSHRMIERFDYRF